jgi:hypothetical protein
MRKVFGKCILKSKYYNYLKHKGTKENIVIYEKKLIIIYIFLCAFVFQIKKSYPKISVPAKWKALSIAAFSSESEP